jgi:transcriptional regulator with XRE-family HTH domain
MTQDEFARRIGITQSHLSALERGDNEPGASVLLAISRAFGKSVDWLLAWRDRRACCEFLNQGHRLPPLPQEVDLAAPSLPQFCIQLEVTFMSFRGPRP